MQSGNYTFSDNSQPMAEVNILLLSETSVGKSTFINGVANYLSYDTLDEAMKNEMKIYIPLEFTMTNENYEAVKVIAGDTNNDEFGNAGNSNTHPVTHTLRINNTVFRLIDTPGIGDTLGLNRTKKNFQQIMNYLSHIDQIHGICVLLNPSNSKISISFEFFLKEFLTQLHKDAVNNVVFCFTNTRSRFYLPGEVLNSLTALLTEGNTSPILIPLEKRTIYCLDNEAFRFLAALKQGETFDDDEMDKFSRSWKASVKETERMIEYFRSLQPIDTTSTVTSNATRQAIIRLAKPMVKILQDTQMEIARLDETANTLQCVNAGGKDLRERVKAPQVDSLLKNLQLEERIPQADHQTAENNSLKTVCTVPGCTGMICLYKTKDSDQLRHEPNQLNCTALQGSSVKSNGTCDQCHHGWDKHIYSTFDSMDVDVIDTTAESDLLTTQWPTKETEIVISQCQMLRQEYEREQETIKNTAGRFAELLNTFIAPFNTSTIRYLDYMIQMEEKKITPGGEQVTLYQLKNLKQVYSEEESSLRVMLSSQDTIFHIFTDTIKKESAPSCARPVSEDNNSLFDEIHELVKALYSLPLTGSTLKHLVQTSTRGSQLNPILY